MNEGEVLKRCSKCGTEKALTGFYPSRKHKSGRLPACKDCVNGESRARYRRRNPVVAVRVGKGNRSYSHGMRSQAPGVVVTVRANVDHRDLSEFAQMIGDKLQKMGTTLAAEVGGYLGDPGEMMVGRIGELAQKAHVLALRLTGESKFVLRPTAFLRANRNAYRAARRRQAGDLQLVLSQCASGWGYIKGEMAAGRRLIEIDPSLRMVEELCARSRRVMRMIEQIAVCLRRGE